MPVSWDSPGVRLLPQCGGGHAHVFQLDGDVRVHPIDMYHLTSSAMRHAMERQCYYAPIFNDKVGGDPAALRLAHGLTLQPNRH